jgi:ankyrin repeat protein
MILDVAAFGYNQSIIDDLERSADNLHEYRKKDVLQQSRLLRNSREAAVKLLLDSGAEIESKDNFGRTPLSWAAQERANVDDGALLMFPGSSRQTLLLRAATQRAGIAKLLLDYGADLESRDYSGRTPLSWAVEGDPKVVKLLLDNGADIESKDNSGRTPLSWAVERNTEMVGLLLNNGADIESKDDSGRTPLSWAMEKGSKAVKLLLDNGADSESKDNSGRIPLSWGETTAEDAETSQPRKKKHECQL